MCAKNRLFILTAALVLLVTVSSWGDFKAGTATRDISPTAPMPMWGYGARHALLSTGVRDPLYAKAIVIASGKDKLAIVGMDIGRGPTEPMMANIRKAVKDASGVNCVMIAGSHTHHGPVIELKDEPGKGKGTYDYAVAYTKDLEGKIIEVINEAAANVRDAKIGWGSEDTKFNHNRHTKIEPKPVDPELAVVRFDDLDGKLIATLVNFAAHPTNLDEMDLRFSSEYPGQIKKNVEADMGGTCIFMQGACGDLSTDRGENNTIEKYGKAMAVKAEEIAAKITTAVPEKPSIKAMDEDFAFKSRLDLHNPMLIGMFQQGFFPELVATLDEFPDNTVRPHLTTVVLNGNLALVGGSGEFFCSHGMRLKQRARIEKTLFFGYCNGHHMYFPTIEATAEGGYGADAMMSWVELGAGERMMDKALINIYTLLGKYEAKKSIFSGM